MTRPHFPAVDPDTKLPSAAVQAAWQANFIDPAVASSFATVATTKVDKGVDVYVADYITGNDIADDTAGWATAIAALPATGGRLVIDSGIKSKVNGAITITGKDKLRVTGAGAKITQTGTAAKTLNFVNCTSLVVEGLELVGKGTENIKQGAGVTSYNGVAGIFLSNCQRVAIRNNHLTNHAGGGIRWTSNLAGAVITGNTVAGIGGTPGNSDNCSDFAIGMSGTSADENIWIENNDLSAHNFGVFAIQTRGLHIVRNNIYDIPGQHGIYASECYDAEFSFNTMWDVALNGIKNQIGNVPHDADRTRYIGNNINGCQNGIVVSSTLADLSNKFTLGDISHNVVQDCTQDGINIQGALQFKVAHNQVDTCDRYGIFAKHFSGAITDNQLWRTQAHGVYAEIVDHSQIERNTFVDCGLNASSTAGWTSVIAAHRSTLYLVTPPSVMLDQNGFRFTSSEPSLYAYAILTGANVTAYHLTSRNHTTKSYSLTSVGSLPPVSASANTYGGWQPADNGFLGATADPQLMSAGQGAMTAGVLYLSRLQVPIGGTIATGWFAVSTLGSGLTSGQCLLGVWDSTGVLIGSADVSSILTSTGMKNPTITVASGKSLTITPGATVFVGLLQNGTTPAQIRGTVSSAFANANVTGFNLRYATMGTGQTALPDPLSGLAAAATGQWWFALKA